MGSLYLRGKTWWMKFYVDGRPVQASTKTTKKMVAKEIMKAAEREAEEQKVPGWVRTDVQFDELVDLYLMDYRVNGRKSLRRAETCSAHLVEFFGGRFVQGITTQLIREYVSGRLEAVCLGCGLRFIGDRDCPACGGAETRPGMSNATINRELSALKRMLTLGADQTPPLVAKPPKISMLVENNARKGFFEPAEFEAVRAALPPHLRPVITFGYKTGWRLEEILSLRWVQVDRAGGSARIDDTKNSDSRMVVFDSELRAMIAALWADRIRARTFHDHVFLNAQGTGRMFRFDKAWKSACRAAGVDRIFHDLRRTAVRNMVRAGIPEGVAMKISGHRTRAVFERYNIVDERDLAEAARRQEEYLDGQNATVTNLATVRSSKAKAV